MRRIAVGARRVRDSRTVAGALVFSRVLCTMLFVVNGSLGSVLLLRWCDLHLARRQTYFVKEMSGTYAW
jgi:hypothetical protein